MFWCLSSRSEVRDLTSLNTKIPRFGMTVPLSNFVAAMGRAEYRFVSATMGFLLIDQGMEFLFG